MRRGLVFTPGNDVGNRSGSAGQSNQSRLTATGAKGRPSRQVPAQWLRSSAPRSPDRPQDSAAAPAERWPRPLPGESCGIQTCLATADAAAAVELAHQRGDGRFRPGCRPDRLGVDEAMTGVAGPSHRARLLPVRYAVAVAGCRCGSTSNAFQVALAHPRDRTSLSSQE